MRQQREEPRFPAFEMETEGPNTVFSVEFDRSWDMQSTYAGSPSPYLP